MSDQKEEPKEKKDKKNILTQVMTLIDERLRGISNQTQTPTSVLRNIFHPSGSINSKPELIRDIITSDRNNAAKAKIPSNLHMTYLDLIPQFGKILDEKNEIMTLEKIWAPTEDCTSGSFGDRYRLNSRAVDGWALDKYSETLQYFVNEAGMRVIDRQKNQLEEGNKHK